MYHQIIYLDVSHVSNVHIQGVDAGFAACLDSDAEISTRYFDADGAR